VICLPARSRGPGTRARSPPTGGGRTVECARQIETQGQRARDRKPASSSAGARGASRRAIRNGRAAAGQSANRTSFLESGADEARAHEHADQYDDDREHMRDGQIEARPAWRSHREHAFPPRWRHGIEELEKRPEARSTSPDGRQRDVRNRAPDAPLDQGAIPGDRMGPFASEPS
jgi:hypothetical protein